MWLMLLKAFWSDVLNQTLSIVLPTYNERENIRLLIPEIKKTLADFEHEILVVDDSSPDGTGDAVKELDRVYGNVKLINKKKKEGIGAALRVGYNAARNEIILSSDVDLSYPVPSMLELINEINSGFDLVVGSRHLNKKDYERNTFGVKIKNFISFYGNKLVRFITGVPVHDFSANFRAIRKNTWQAINTQDKTNSILMEMIVKTHYHGFKVKEIPVTFKDRVHGQSKLKLGREAPKFLLKTLRYSLQERLKL